jgi:hypothetical protein
MKLSANLDYSFISQFIGYGADNILGLSEPCKVKAKGLATATFTDLRAL